VSEFVVITGLSGAGRSQAADCLEDLGWYVVDNLPTSLVPEVARTTADRGTDKVCLVTGPGPYQDDVIGAVANLRAAGHRVRVVFLDASTHEIVRRYGSTRRRHPLAGDSAASIPDAIDRERSLLDALKAQADVVIDTSDLNIHQLRARMVDLFAGDLPMGGLQVTVSSFGYKHGLPLDAELVFDCRFLPNPHWDEQLRPQTGLDEPVRRYVFERGPASAFLDAIEALLDIVIPAYAAEGKSYLNLAFGCTGGRHRSVALSEELASRLRRRGVTPIVQHRDLAR
jgi:UPF0042 nucleotide-binding protein